MIQLFPEALSSVPCCCRSESSDTKYIHRIFRNATYQEKILQKQTCINNFKLSTVLPLDIQGRICLEQSVDVKHPLQCSISTSLVFVHHAGVKDEKELRRNIFSFTAFVLFICKREDALAAWMAALRRCDSSLCKCTHATSKLFSFNSMDNSISCSHLPGTHGT